MGGSPWKLSLKIFLKCGCGSYPFKHIICSYPNNVFAFVYIPIRNLFWGRQTHCKIQCMCIFVCILYLVCSWAYLCSYITLSEEHFHAKDSILIVFCICLASASTLAGPCFPSCLSFTLCLAIIDKLPHTRKTDAWRWRRRFWILDEVASRK